MTAESTPLPQSAEQLPGVAWILNPARLADLPLAHSVLFERLGGAGAAGGLHLATSYLRYKPSVAAVARLDVSHGSAVSGEPVNNHPAPAQVLWVATYAPQTAGKVEKLRATLQQLHGDRGQEMVASCPVPGHPGHVLAVGLPGADPKLSKVLVKTLGAPAAQLGTAHSPWQMLRFNPQRRMVLAGGPVDWPAATVLKITAEPNPVSESTLAALASHGAPIQVPTACPGITRDPRVRGYPWYGDGDLTARAVNPLTLEAAVQAGAGLGRLHQAHRDSPRELLDQLPASADPVARMEAMACDLVAVDADVAKDLRAVAQRVTRNLHHGPDSSAPIQALHGDFSADQVLVDSRALTQGSNDDGVLLADLDRIRRGWAEDDLGNAVSAGIMGELAQLERSQAWTPGVHPVTAALLRGYRRSGAQPADSRIRTWAAFHLLMRAMAPFRDCDPHWPHRMRQVVEAAGALVPDTVPKTLVVPGTPAQAATFTVKRAWPKADGRLSAEVIDSRGRIRAAEATPNAQVLGLPEWKVNSFGSDRKLPALKQFSLHGRVVVHRRGRRAVVATDDRYIKLLAADKAPQAARLSQELHELGTAAGFAVPQVLGRGADRIEFSVVTGQDLHTAGASGQDHAYATGIRGWANRWPDLVRSELLSTDLPTYTVTQEIQTLDDWRQRLAAFPAALDVDPVAWARAVGAVQRMLADLPSSGSWCPGVLHRDLHEKQLLVDTCTGSIGLLDFDTAAIGDPALDLANLGVHLDLHRAQGLLSPQLHTLATTTVTEVARELDATPERLLAYRAATRARLVCVYAFRPQWRPLATTWAEDLIRDM